MAIPIDINRVAVPNKFLRDESNINLTEEVNKVFLDRSYLWYARWANINPCGERVKLPKMFAKWFPCENVTEPLGWEIEYNTETFYMTKVSVPISVGQQVLTITGIIDNSNKEVELWFLNWYNSFHFKHNVFDPRTNGGLDTNSFFHHAATLSEFARILIITRLTLHRQVAYEIAYYVTPSGSMINNFSYSSQPKKIDNLNLNIHGKTIRYRQEYIQKFDRELFTI